ncbi:hypothetical protein SCALIN_C17_0025 [Candidatus Scalindua japonica]|uniref:Uncharacterized protein n=1 Tax=Candidatus Scalindua japonica TaxID=1284222 RepID=A0A286TYM9_9BACT|nr:hypothetical protein [Candidatus Scalindua japonica]GAX60992.1 hypothetical protein SCALIN_C17_0025 [Candidatus Scalindua japonica]
MDESIVEDEATTFKHENGNVASDETIYKLLMQELEKNLQWLRKVALLEA